jgi:flagellar hook protein FlgE
MNSMYIGITGMAAANDGLATISNNIANSQTNGFKQQQVEFEDLFYQQVKAASGNHGGVSGSNPIEMGNGVKVGATTTNFAQGSLKYTGLKTDVAVQGNGFFVLGESGSTENNLYTRDGGFKLSNDNQLVSKSGLYVMGWNADPLTGKMSQGSIVQPIQIDLGQISKPTETKNIVLAGNLKTGSLAKGSTTGIQVAAFDKIGTRFDANIDFIKTGASSYQYVSSIDGMALSGVGATGIQKAVLNLSASSAAGIGTNGPGAYTLDVGAPDASNQVLVTVKKGATTVFTQTINNVAQTTTLENGAGNSWFTIDFKPTSAATTVDFTIAETGVVTFDSSGNVVTATGTSPSTKPRLTFNSPATGLPMQIDVDMSGMTGLNVDSVVKLQSTDGFGASVLQNFSIGDGGIVSGNYSDGSVRTVAQLAMASFSNASGLDHVGSGSYRQSANSGVAEVGVAGTGSRGDIKSQSLETSNVDLTKEFVDLIMMQKNLSANTKIIRVADDTSNSVISLIR